MHSDSVMRALTYILGLLDGLLLRQVAVNIATKQYDDATFCAVISVLFGIVALGAICAREN